MGDAYYRYDESDSSTFPQALKLYVTSNKNCRLLIVDKIIYEKHKQRITKLNKKMNVLVTYHETCCRPKKSEYDIESNISDPHNADAQSLGMLYDLIVKK